MRQLPKQSGILPEPQVETPRFTSRYKPGDIVKFKYKGQERQGSILLIDNTREIVVVDFAGEELKLHESKVKKVDNGKKPMFAFESIFDLGLFKTAKKKKDWDPNPWAVCNSVGLSKKKSPKKFEDCVMSVKKKQASKDKVPGGLADKKKPSDFDSDALEKGIKVELEHTDDKNLAKEITMDHLKEHPKYYEDDFLPKMEKELTEDEKKSSQTIYFNLMKTAEEDKEWIQEAVPESHEGRFKSWCKKNGFKGVCQACINKAIAKGGHSSKMANFAINVSKGKYSHPK